MLRVVKIQAYAHARLIGLNITGGSASHSSGIWVAERSVANIEGCNVYGCHASHTTGGVGITGTGTLDSSNVFSNTCLNWGAGIYIFGLATVTKSNVFNNTVVGVSWSAKRRGGGVYFTGGNAKGTFINTNIHSNTADIGGGFYIEPGGEAVLYGGDIYDNTADTGPNVYLGGQMTLSGSLLTDFTGLHVSDGTVLEVPAPPAPPPPTHPTPTTQDGAVIEMTGEEPKLIFGTLQNPTCQLSMDRLNSRLVSTCSIHDSRRLEETVEYEGKYLALEKKYEALQSEVSELRRSVDAMMAKK